MKCLTIPQPYAQLIVAAQEKLPPGQVRKKCENRQWKYPVRYRGPLLIHAGQSRKWLLKSDWPREREGELVFGAIVGVAWLEDCIPMRRDGLILECAKGFKDKYRALGLVLDDHPHCLGPLGLMLGHARAFEQPITYAGALGLFDVDDALVMDQVQRSGFPPKLLKVLREAEAPRLAAGPRF